MVNKINGGEIYFKTLHEVSNAINSYIQNQVKLMSLSKNLEDMLLELPKKRADKGIMRSTMTYLIYKNLGGEAESERITPVLALSELSNYFCYLDNWIFDNKNNSFSDPEKIKMITASSQIFRELSQQLLEDSEVSDDSKRQISRGLAESTLNCYKGYVRDLNDSIQDIPNFKSDEDFIKYYEERAELQSGNLYEFSAEIGVILAGKKGTERKTVKEFGRVFGTGLHISNDLGDFSLSLGKDGSFKLYQDQLADIINGRLTYPIYYALKYGTEYERYVLNKMIGNREASLEDKKEAASAIINSGAYKKTIAILNGYRNRLKNIVRNLPDNSYRDCLSSMIETIRYNRYLKELKKLGAGENVR